MKRSALLIGLFVVTGLVLAALIISSLGGHKLFDKRIQAVVHFNGTVKGLYIGAPVTFRGVPVGQVDAIGLELNQQTLVTRVPVQISLMPKMFSPDGKVDAASQALASLVQRGLSARLAQQSLVTGQALIDLDFIKRATPLPVVTQVNDKMVEIPVIKGQFDDLVAQLSDLPLKETVEDLRKTLNAVNGTAAAAQQAIVKVGADFSQTTQVARELMQHTDKTIATVGQQAGVGLQAITTLSNTTQNTILKLQPDLEATLASARQAARSADVGFQSLADMTAPGSGAREDLQGAVRDLAQTARSLREVSELLERQPNALLFGKQ